MSRALTADARLLDEVDEEFARIVARVDLAVTARLDPFSEPDPESESSPESAPAEKEKEQETAPEKETEDKRGH